MVRPPPSSVSACRQWPAVFPIVFLDRRLAGIPGWRGDGPTFAPSVCRSVKGGETATLVYGFYGVGEDGVTAFTEYVHRVLEVRGVQFSTGHF
jgi:hypothetical protein